MASLVLSTVLCSLLAYVHCRDVCGGLEITDFSYANINPNSAAVADSNYTVSLMNVDGKCCIVPKGCINVKKPYKTAQANIQCKKNNARKMSLSYDMCDLSEFAKTCPGEKGAMCKTDNRGKDVTGLKLLLNVNAGTYACNVTVKHDNGLVSRFNVTFCLKNSKKLLG